jgi:TonB family protein
MIITIYGENLAPTPWCGVSFSQKPPFPMEACGVRVLVGDSPAGLMSAGPKQINLVLPADAPTLGKAPIRVCVREVCSAPLEMQFSTHKIFLKVEGKAYVHMPVWLEVEHPAPYEFRYPCGDWPWGIDNAVLDVRYSGLPIMPLVQPKPLGGVVGGFGCSAAGYWKPSRFPLHLLYRLHQPGTYSVKLTTHLGSTSESDWTDIVVEPFSAAQREGWLHLIDERMKRASPKELAGDIIPSLLAYPDEKALVRVVRLIDHPDRMVKEFARQSLVVFNEEAIRRAIPAERLVELCPPRGQCKALAPDGHPAFVPGSVGSRPIVLQKVAPEYTEEARKAKREGSVVFRMQIDAAGQAIVTGVLRPLGLGLDEKAFEAVKKWKFAPGLQDGKPVTAEMTVAVEFRL